MAGEVWSFRGDTVMQENFRAILGPGPIFLISLSAFVDSGFAI